MALGASAQSSAQLINLTTSYTYAPDEIIYPTTNASSNSKIVIDVKNISASTQVYKVIRTDVSLNAGALAYFCFAGGCYSELTTTSPTNLTLTAGQRASQVQGIYNTLTADLDEGPAVGESIVEYQVVNVSNNKDVARVTIKYNYSGAVGINEKAGSALLFDVYPNPAGEKLVVRIGAPLLNEASVLLSNALGQELVQKSVVLDGADTGLTITTGDLPPGLYFVTVKSGTVSSTKKILVGR